MSIPIPSTSPKFVVNGQNYALAAVNLGFLTRIGLFVQNGAGYDGVNQIIDYAGSPTLLADIQAKGGIVKYCAWLKTAINTYFPNQFPATPTGEPTTEQQAIDAVNAWLAAQAITVTSDQPKIV